jgi:hypothetical protein
MAARIVPFAVRHCRRTVKWPFVAVRHARRHTAKWLVHRAPEPAFVVRLVARRTAKGIIHRAPWTNLCRAPRHVTHSRGHGQPCALTTLCRAPARWRTAKSTTVPVRAQRRTIERVWCCLPADGRQHIFFVLRHILRTAKNGAVRCLSPRRMTKVFAG